MLKNTPPHGVLGDGTARTQRCWRLQGAHLGDLHCFSTPWKHGKERHSGLTGV